MNNLQSHITDCLLWREQRVSASFKQAPADFIVKENLPWEFSGQGEHLFLEIEKTNCNTLWIARQLSKFYGVPPRDIGYSGLKDKYAVTTQYFSIRLPGIRDYELPIHEEYRVISHQIHHKKLKRGNHKSNYFEIRLRDVAIDEVSLAEKIAWIKNHGMPNFFDSQRFGRDEGNLQKVSQWANGDIEFRKRDDISLMLSSLRASVFNEILALRIADKTWDKALVGDIMGLEGSNSAFHISEPDQTIERRVAELDIHPTGLMIGLGELGTSDVVAAIENNIVAKYFPIYENLMNKHRLEASRRALRVKIDSLSYQVDSEGIVLSFNLPTGSYASALVKQLFVV